VRGGAGGGGRSPKLRRYEQAREGEKEARTDVAFAVVCDDDLCKALVDGHVLFERCALAKQFRLGRIRNCVVQTRPEHLSRRSAVALGKAKARRTWWQNSSWLGPGLHMGQANNFALARTSIDAIATTKTTTTRPLPPFHHRHYHHDCPQPHPPREDEVTPSPILLCRRRH
jgi:hypothetical protein